MASGLIIGGVGVAGAAGLLNIEDLVPEAEVGGTLILVGGIAASFLFSRARFTVEALDPDPGALNIERTVDHARALVAANPAPRILMVYDVTGSTYSIGRQAPVSQRFACCWGFLPGQGRSGRVMEFKFATLHVVAKWNDAPHCHATAEVLVRNGHGGTIKQGVWNALGSLNWHSDQIVSALLKPVIGADGSLLCPTLDRIHDTPGLGLNEYLSNPEVSLNEKEAVDLPLYYMRNGWPEVYLCGPLLGVSAGSPPKGEPLDLAFGSPSPPKRRRGRRSTYEGGPSGEG